MKSVSIQIPAKSMIKHKIISERSSTQLLFFVASLEFEMASGTLINKFESFVAIFTLV